MAIDAGNLDAAHRRMAQGAGADAAVAVNGENDVVAMAARAGGGPGYPIMVLDCMVFIIVRIWGVASGTVRSKAGVDGISHFLTDAGVMASGARSWWIVGRAIMQGDNLGRRRECAVAVVALGAA